LYLSVRDCPYRKCVVLVEKNSNKIEADIVKRFIFRFFKENIGLF